MDRKNNKWTVKPNPDRIREARLARGMAMIELAEPLGVTRQAISKYENDEMSPSIEIVQKMARTLSFPESFFFTEFSNPSHNNETIYYRSLKSTENMYKSMYTVRLVWLERLMQEMSECIRLPKFNFPEPIDISLDASHEQIDEAASKLREFWGLGLNPISNVTMLVERNGIIITYIPYGQTQIDACSKIQGDRAVIMLSADKSSAFRTRFDISHELGHLLLHRYISKEEFERESNFKIIENQAHAFAGAFLMPQKTFAREVYSTSLEHLFALKKRWKVSIAAIIKRCEALNLFTDSQVQRLYIELGKRKWRKSEPLDDITPVETPTLLKKAFDLIYSGKVASPVDFRDRLCLLNQDFEELTTLQIHDYPGNSEPKEIKLHLLNND